MGVLVLGREAEQRQGLRPLDILRDLHGVGRLIDVAFADDIAQEGSQFLQDLSILTVLSPAMWALRRISADMRDALDGFVWIEDGAIVGNVTLSRDDTARRVWTITNVAVHPSYRRRGIAETLLQAGLDAVHQRGGGFVVLQVKPANTAACDLYRSMGFRFVDGIVTTRRCGPLAMPLPLAGQARPVRVDEWPKLYALLKGSRAPLAERITPLRERDYRRSLLQRVANVMSDVWYQEQRLWLAIEEGEVFLAAARVHLRLNGSNTIDVSILPDGQRYVEPLLQAALARCTQSDRTITVHVASGEASALALLEHAGFKETRHLHRLMCETTA